MVISMPLAACTAALECDLRSFPSLRPNFRSLDLGQFRLRVRCAAALDYTQLRLDGDDYSIESLDRSGPEFNAAGRLVSEFTCTNARRS